MLIRIEGGDCWGPVYHGILAASAIAVLPGLLSDFLRKRRCNLLWTSRTRFSKGMFIMQLLFGDHSKRAKTIGFVPWLPRECCILVTIFHCFVLLFDISTDQ